MEANQLLRAKLSSTAATALQDVDVANEGLISSIDGEILFATSYYSDFWNIESDKQTGLEFWTKHGSYILHLQVCWNSTMMHMGILIP